MGRVRDQDLAARTPVLSVPCPHDQQGPVSSPDGAGGRLEGGGVHTRIRHNALVRPHSSSSHPWAYAAGVAGWT